MRWLISVRQQRLAGYSPDFISTSIGTRRLIVLGLLDEPQEEDERPQTCCTDCRVQPDL